MLSEIRLDKAYCASVDFEYPTEKRGAGSGGGNFHVDFKDVLVEANKKYVNSEEKVNVLEITAFPAMTGYDGEDKSETFKLSLEIKMFFSYREDLTLDSDFLTENIWYFKNLICIYYKFYAEDIINKSPLKGIDVPPRPND
ncbi:hypothetical protein [Pantoea septica]|uniref:hypothetical protein n=1 Tax=Pantoea septica TaxID=472695 RepID=UPI0028A63404|nr:hypothetical protein [Pantoea septica]